MNRIYQGRVSDAEIADGKNWKPFAAEPKTARAAWERALWEHHELFQDAVNYYTLALAALAEGLTAATEQGKAALAWREQVRGKWTRAQRKAREFNGPHKRLARLLGVDAEMGDSEKSFDACAARVIRANGATAEQRAEALLRLLELAGEDESGGNKLAKLCREKLPFFCKQSVGSGDDVTAGHQMVERQAQVSTILNGTTESLASVADKVGLRCFFRTPPTKSDYTGAEAITRLLECFDGITKPKKARGKSAKVKPARFPELAAMRSQFEGELRRLLAADAERLRVPNANKPPAEMAPTAVFKFLPCAETWEACKVAVASVLKRKVDRSLVSDPISAVRSGGIVFDYFTNQTCVDPIGTKRSQAVWFEFDLAAFIEAIKSPHRYYQDTQSRDAAARKVREKLHAIDPDGPWLKDRPKAAPAKPKKAKAANEHEEDETPAFTFAGDARITLLSDIVTDKLAWLGEAEEPDQPGEKKEYTIRQRTLRAWGEVRDAWRKLAAKGPVTPETLWKEAAEIQAEHRDDYGSATLIQELAKTENHSIWQKSATPNLAHADDSLQAWRLFTELRQELRDKERPIRFTPAHASESPRYFILPKSGRFGTEHQRAPGDAALLEFTCGIILRTEHGLEPVAVRLSYSAPRLRRDELRAPGEGDLAGARWVQPMMQALGVKEADAQDFGNCRVTLQPKKIEPGGADAGVEETVRYNHQLTFPVEVEPAALQAAIGKGPLWARQFNLHPDGDSFYDANLRWPHEKQPAKPPLPWHDALDAFTIVAVDLGQRDAGAYAVITARAGGDASGKPSRYIGQTGEGEGAKTWRAELAASGMLRLSGEDRVEWRNASKLEGSRGENGFAWREELYGERGRSATAAETDECADLLAKLGVREPGFMPPAWRETLSFPEQNDKLLRAASRAQAGVARRHRWAEFLAKADDVKRRDKAMEEIQDVRKDASGNPDQAQAALAALAKDGKAEELRATIFDELRRATAELPPLLVQIANRVLPLRGRSWCWRANPAKPDCGLLDQSGPKREDVHLRGQRGLSMERIEQIEELRKRFQSLNQSQRRTPGGPAPKRRDDSIPDPCPDLLEKLDRMKSQRINQTAHMILAQALGVRLRTPSADKARLREERDQHGQYEPIPGREPVDFIVIEDLSRYRSSQGRAPRENRKLMQWCHRAVRDKLKELCEPFGLPVVETPAAWSSRFCARSGVAGFRAVEVHPGLRNEAPWAWHLRRWDEFQKNKDTLPEDERKQEEKLADARKVSELFAKLDDANRDTDNAAPRPKWRTLYAPQTGGPIFLPICDAVKNPDHPKLQPAVVQSDINAAINLALRAIADPRLWSIHQRLRTQREGKGGELRAREKRKYGAKNAPPLSIEKAAKVDEDDARQPNYFHDASRTVPWGHAEVEDPLTKGKARLVSGAAMWKTVREAQWARVDEINTRRLKSWDKRQEDRDDIPK